MRTYATIITTDDYLLGALTLHKSLILTKPRYHLLVAIGICRHTDEVHYVPTASRFSA